mmetsp:Transcript_26375/g.47795  ORF Transcript_26375/g.47795 Transcript_26375/m.47795 type:complete len:209 (-) Transcript_26375:320-946(-)
MYTNTDTISSLKLPPNNIRQPNLLKVFIPPILQHVLWLRAHIIPNIQNFKPSIFQQRTKGLVAESIIVIWSRVVLIRPRDEVQRQAALFGYSSNGIEALPRSGGVLEYGVAEGDVVAAIRSLRTIVDVANDRVGQLLRIWIRIEHPVFQWTGKVGEFGSHLLHPRCDASRSSDVQKYSRLRPALRVTGGILSVKVCQVLRERRQVMPE